MDKPFLFMFIGSTFTNFKYKIEQQPYPQPPRRNFIRQKFGFVLVFPAVSSDDKKDIK